MKTENWEGAMPLIRLLMCFTYQAYGSVKNKQVAYIVKKRLSARYALWYKSVPCGRFYFSFYL